MRIDWQDNQVEIAGDRGSFCFDRQSGALRCAKRSGAEHPFIGLLADAGVDGSYVRGQMVFDPLFEKRTWELPAIKAVHQEDAAEFLGLTEEDGALIAGYRAGGMLIRQVYDLCQGALRMRARVTNMMDSQAVVNGVSFILRRKAGEASFEYPTNDSAVYPDREMEDGKAHSCGLVGSMTHIHAEPGSINLLFLDEVEKWSQGAYRAQGRGSLL